MYQKKHTVMKETKGIISKIERFSVHDGPGIRTLVVLKGCPLSCRWCSSPYTQKPAAEILYIRSHCQVCGACIPICSSQAIELDTVNHITKTNRSDCVGCGACVSACPNQARELSGFEISAEELFTEVDKDAAFFRRSGGGVTVGGGEPTAQSDFLRAFLTICRENYIDTAMETTALTSWQNLESLLKLLDRVYIDLKHMNTDLHKEWTGVPNKVILENIRKTAESYPVILRIPVVPGFNDSEENILESAQFAKSLGNNLLRLELLPYHPFGIHKYLELERIYTLEDVEAPSEATMEKLSQIVRGLGLDAQIGG